MLYNKRHVEYEQKSNHDVNHWVRVTNPFKLPMNVIAYFQDKLLRSPRERKPLIVLANLAALLNTMITYDDKHDYQGIRTAGLTLKDEKGHCIEQNTVLYAIAASLLPQHRSAFSWIIAKNPHGYVCKPMKEVGVHPFLSFRYQGVEYIADVVKGEVKKFDPVGFAITTERLTYREFIAWALLYGGEDVGLVHHDPKSALNWMGAAHFIDPKNYTIDLLAAQMLDKLKRWNDAERVYRRAIQIAPRALETHSEYADFLASYRIVANSPSRDNEARKEYETALSFETQDVQFLSELEQSLVEFESRDLARKARRKCEDLLRTPHFKKYFAHF